MKDIDWTKYNEWVKTADWRGKNDWVNVSDFIEQSGWPEEWDGTVLEKKHEIFILSEDGLRSHYAGRSSETDSYDVCLAQYRHKTQEVTAMLHNRNVELTLEKWKKITAEGNAQVEMW